MSRQSAGATSETDRLRRIDLHTAAQETETTTFSTPARPHSSSMAADEDAEVNGWPTGREALTYQEARNVLDAQRETLTDIDDEALQTVRLTAVLLGLFIAAGRIGGPDLFDPNLSAVGVILLFGSITTGIATYSESDVFLGPNRRYVEQLATDSFVGTEWHTDYLMTAAFWIGENADDIRWNGQLLTLTQGLLLLGLGALTLAIAF